MKRLALSSYRLLVALTSLGLLAASPAHAQDYPSKPINFIVASTPGGILDTIGRIVAKGLEKLGQPVVVQNIGGAGGTVGTAAVAAAAPDGYTVGMVSTSHAINPSVYEKLPFDTMRDLQPLSQAVNLINVLVVNPNLPAKTVAEFLELARKQPGKMTFGSAGTGQINHLSGQMLNTLAGTEMMHVPYKGSAASMVDVMAGTIDSMFVDVLSSAPQIKAGKLRALAVSSSERQPLLPDVPTFAEAGFPQFNANSWLGVVTRAGTPPEIVERLGAAAAAAVNDPEVKAKLISMGVQPVGSSPAEFTRHVANEMKRFSDAVKSAGIKN